MNRLSATESALLPAQVLSEFSSVSLSKIDPPLSPSEATEVVGTLRAAFDVIPLTPAVVLEALRGVEAHTLSFYDAQIWAASRLAQAEYLLTEDFNHGQQIDGVTIVNPFIDDGRELLADVFGVPR